MIWQTYAPQNDKYEWKWLPKYHKWVRFNDYAERNAQNNVFRNRMIENDKLARGKVSEKTAEAMDKSDQEYADSVAHNVQRENQEANAWGHQYYGNFHYYDTDTEHQPSYWKQLNGMSNDQLYKNQKFWNAQIQHINKNGHPKNKNYWTIGGDAAQNHINSNYGDAGYKYGDTTDKSCNPVYLLVSEKHDYDLNAGKIQRKLIGKATPLNHYFNGKIAKENNKLAEAWNADMLRQEQLRAQLTEQTKRGGNYQQLNTQYKQAKKLTNARQNIWKQFIKSTGNKRAKQLLHRIFTRAKGQIGKQYYLNTSYLNHDKMRLAQVQKALSILIPKRHQEAIDASIRSQIMANGENPIAHSMGQSDKPYWTSIYRQDRQTDTVARIAELTPQETWDLSANQHSVDSQMPQTDFAQINQGQLTDSAVIYGPNDANRQQQYNVLRRWMFAKRRLVIIGFNRWQPILITNLSRSPRQEATDNGMNITITFLDIRIAKITWAKQKPQKGKSKGRNNKKVKKIKIRPGMTYCQEAAKYHLPLKQVMNANKYTARRLPVGGTMNIP